MESPVADAAVNVRSAEARAARPARRDRIRIARKPWWPQKAQADGVARASKIPGRRHQRALADVSAQRQTDPPPGRRRVRRAPLRIWRADGSAEGPAARQLRARRARSAWRPRACSRDRRCSGACTACRWTGCRRPTRRSRPKWPKPDSSPTPRPRCSSAADVVDAYPVLDEPMPIDTTAELLGRAKAAQAAPDRGADGAASRRPRQARPEKTVRAPDIEAGGSRRRTTAATPQSWRPIGGRASALLAFQVVDPLA